MSLLGQLNRRATIERATAAVSSTGAVSLSWSTVATNVPCALQPRRAHAEQREPGLRLETAHVAYFDAATDVRPQSQGGVGDRVTIDSVSYIVVHVADVAGRGRLLRAEMKREK